MISRILAVFAATGAIFFAGRGLDAWGCTAPTTRTEVLTSGGAA